MRSDRGRERVRQDEDRVERVGWMVKSSRRYVDPHLSFSNHISNLSCFMHIRDLRRVRPMLDFKTASTIATSIVHSKLHYCNSLFLSLDSTQIHRLQLIQNSLARAVTRTPRYHHIMHSCS